MAQTRTDLPKTGDVYGGGRFVAHIVDYIGLEEYDLIISDDIDPHPFSDYNEAPYNNPPMNLVNASTTAGSFYKKILTDYMATEPSIGGYTDWFAPYMPLWKKVIALHAAATDNIENFTWYNVINAATEDNDGWDLEFGEGAITDSDALIPQSPFSRENDSKNGATSMGPDNETNYFGKWEINPTQPGPNPFNLTFKHPFYLYAPVDQYKWVANYATLHRLNTSTYGGSSYYVGNNQIQGAGNDVISMQYNNPIRWDQYAPGLIRSPSNPSANNTEVRLFRKHNVTPTRPVKSVDTFTGTENPNIANTQYITEMIAGDKGYDTTTPQPADFTNTGVDHFWNENNLSSTRTPKEVIPCRGSGSKNISLAARHHQFYKIRQEDGNPVGDFETHEVGNFSDANVRFGGPFSMSDFRGTGHKGTVVEITTRQTPSDDEGILYNVGIRRIDKNAPGWTSDYTNAKFDSNEKRNKWGYGLKVNTTGQIHLGGNNTEVSGSDPWIITDSTTISYTNGVNADNVPNYSYISGMVSFDSTPIDGSPYLGIVGTDSNVKRSLELIDWTDGSKTLASVIENHWDLLY